MILANLFGFKSSFYISYPWQIRTENLWIWFWENEFFFKSLSFQNRLSYWTLLGLEWKIFCHSLVIRFYFYIGYWSLAAMNMSRCPYIYELDGRYNKQKQFGKTNFCRNDWLFLVLRFWNDLLSLFVLVEFNVLFL